MSDDFSGHNYWVAFMSSDSTSFLMVSAEYAAMARAETTMWWFRALHQHILSTIEKRFGADRSLKIVDAGCGTGGLLKAFQDKGYVYAKGLDISKDALQSCRSRGFSCEEGSILDISKFFAPASLDVIVSNDVLCCPIEKADQEAFVRQAYDLLKPGGMLIVNLPSLQAFRGIHDLSVALVERFDKPRMRHLAEQAGWSHVDLRYRLFLLSPLFFAIRTFQRFMLRFFKNQVAIVSDVKTPNFLLNEVLYLISRCDDALWKFCPWGPSLFGVFRK